ncbi:HAD-IA family hydrolase [Candidatus Neoehrlichia procyonis]|uniref:phosphoglycolate phosphatase n=1 Tax=Candidatus Neoehrlichia procyonis str. RAC413 TaxID=1359163 RepID=A0A0F3NN76_9RICK|nr:HAD-IA family hydrolase [Candidatus Neoehrlichia lotoris]KJV69132.1 HAD hydrolase, IA, variant 1 family protein [Candidatus Neoehrlichia lotoris str. RAC413]
MIYPTNVPSAVIFDWYNTIVNTSNINYQIVSQTLSKKNNALLNSKLKKLSISHEQILNKSQTQYKIQLNDNILELLELLHQNNISMAIVSNKNGHYLRRDVYDIGIAKYFKSIIGAGDTPENKPSPKPILAALEMINLPPNEKVFFIGDSISDVESAKNANCFPIMYNSNINISGVLSFTHFKEFSNLIINLLN